VGAGEGFTAGTASREGGKDKGRVLEVNTDNGAPTLPNWGGGATGAGGGVMVSGGGGSGKGTAS